MSVVTASGMELRPPSDLVDADTGLAFADYTSLPQTCHSDFQKTFESDVGLCCVFYLAEVLKYNKKLMENRKVLAVTKTHLYVLTPRAEVIRCTALNLIQEVYHCRSTIALKIPDEFDLMLKVTAANKMPDVLSADYLLHVLQSLGRPNLQVYRDVTWLSKSSVVARETCRQTLNLARPSSWQSQAPEAIDRCPWEQLVLRPGFESTWRKIHPSRSKLVWEIREKAEARRNDPAAAAAAAAANASGASSIAVTPAGSDATTFPASSSPANSGRRRSGTNRRASFHFPQAIADDGQSGAPATGGGASAGDQECWSAQALGEGHVEQDTDLFDLIAGSPALLGGVDSIHRYRKKYPHTEHLGAKAPPRLQHRSPVRHNNTQTRASDLRDAEFRHQQQRHMLGQRSGGDADGSDDGQHPHSQQPPLPRGPPPPLPPRAAPPAPHTEHSQMMAVAAGVASKERYPAVASGVSPRFPPTSVASPGSASPARTRGGGAAGELHQETGRPDMEAGEANDFDALDPQMLELAAAASPVPYDVYALRQAIRVMHEREAGIAVDTPTLGYEDARTLPEHHHHGGFSLGDETPPHPLDAHPDRVFSRTGHPTPSAAGVRPSLYSQGAPARDTATPVNRYWVQNDLPGAQTAESAGGSSEPGGGGVGGVEQTSAADLARRYAEATQKPGGGGQAARKAISHVLRTAAALLNIDDAVAGYDDTLRKVARVTPTPKGTRRFADAVSFGTALPGTLTAEDLAAAVAGVADGSGGGAAAAGTPHRSGVFSSQVPADSTPYLAALLDEQERQRLGLDLVCRKLDLLIQSPGGGGGGSPGRSPGAQSLGSRHASMRRSHSPTGTPKEVPFACQGTPGEGDSMGYGTGGPGDLQSPEPAVSAIGTPLLPVPDDARLSKYQKALHRSIRPLNHTPPAAGATRARHNAVSAGKFVSGLERGESPLQMSYASDTKADGKLIPRRLLTKSATPGASVRSA